MKPILLLIFSLLLFDLSSQEVIFENELYTNSSCLSFIDDKILIGGLTELSPYFFEVDDELNLVDESEPFEYEVYNHPSAIFLFYEDWYIVCLRDGSIYLYYSVFDNFFQIDKFDVEGINNFFVEPISYIDHNLIMVGSYYTDGIVNSTLSVLNIKFDTIQVVPQILLDFHHEWTYTKEFEYEVKSVYHSEDGLHIWGQTESELTHQVLDKELIEISSSSINTSNELIQIERLNSNELIGLFYDSDTTSIIAWIDSVISMDHITSLAYHPAKLLVVSDSLIYTGNTTTIKSNYWIKLDLEIHKIEIKNNDIFSSNIFKKENAQFIDFALHDEALWIIGNSPISDVADEERAIVIKLRDELVSNETHFISEPKVTLYPNPAQDRFLVHSDISIENLKLIDQLGHISPLTKEGEYYSVSHLSAGLYYVLINNNQILKNPIFINHR